MSSKENIASADSLSSKKAKKDKKKKEKKDKKEKNAKTETKQAEKNNAGDAYDNMEANQSQEDPQSPKKTKRFGMFRLSGKKSKSEKKSAKHGSRDSLKKDDEGSPDSVQFGKRVSIGSLDESTSGTEPASGSAESHEESDARLSDLGESFEVAKSQELNEEPENNDVIVPQQGLPKGESVEEKEKPYTRQDKPDLNVETTVIHEDLVYRVETSKGEQSTEECGDIQELSPVPVLLSQTFEFEQQSSILSNKSKDDQNPNDTSRMKNEECVTVMKSEDVSKETEGGVVSGSVRVDAMQLEDVTKEHDRDVTSSEDGSVDTVVSTGFPNTEIVTMDAETKPKDYTINGETKEKDESENQYAYEKTGDLEELIMSTYSDRKTIKIKEEDGEELLPNEEAVVLEYVAKQKEVSIRENHGEAGVEEEPIVLKVMKVNSFQEEMLQVHEEPDMSQITEWKEMKPQEAHFEGEPIALTEKNADAFTEERTVVEGVCNTQIVGDIVDETKPNYYTINGEAKEKEEGGNEYAYDKSGDVEELIISTYSDRKTIKTKEEDGEELPPNEEAVVLEYVAKQKDVSTRENHGEAGVEEEPIVLTEIKINSFQEEMLQVQEEPEEEPIALTEENAHALTEQRTVHVSRISKGVGDKTKEHGSSEEEELVTPIRVERREREMQEKAQEETPENEGVVLTYPEKTEQPNLDEPQSREERVVLIYSEKQVHPQQDQPIGVGEKDTAQGKHKETVKNNEETSKYERKRVQEPIDFGVNKRSSLLDQPRNQPLSSSTPKLNTSHEGIVKPDYNYTARSYIEHTKRVQFVTSVRDVKLSIKLLLAQLAEENKKLRALQLALNEVLKIGLVQRA